jgi:hypothetical protein
VQTLESTFPISRSAMPKQLIQSAYKHRHRIALNSIQKSLVGSTFKLKYQWHRISNTNVIKLNNMKTTLTIAQQQEELDKELRDLLKQDIKRFRAKREELLSNNQANTKDNDLLVA